MSRLCIKQDDMHGKFGQKELTSRINDNIGGWFLWTVSNSFSPWPQQSFFYPVGWFMCIVLNSFSPLFASTKFFLSRRMVLVDEHNSALPYSHAEWAHSNLGHYQVRYNMEEPQNLCCRRINMKRNRKPRLPGSDLRLCAMRRLDWLRIGM